MSRSVVGTECPPETVRGQPEAAGVPPVPAPLHLQIPPLPALPVLPSIDPTALIRPITDLLEVFGTGCPEAGGSGDPAHVHQQITGVIIGGVDRLLSATRALDGVWTGQGAAAAVTAALRTAGEAGLLAAQGAGMSADLQAAAAIVATGAAQLHGVIAKTAGLLTAMAPTLATPPGQLAAVGVAAEGLAEGLGVVAATRAQLAGPTAHMAANGRPVPVTGLPGIPAGGADDAGFGLAAQLLQSALPFVQAGTGLATSLLSGTGLTAEHDAPPPAAPVPAGTAGACAPTCERTAVPTAPPGTPGTPAAGGAGASSASSASGGASASGSVSAKMSTAGAGAAVGPAVATSAGVAADPAPLADRPTTTNASAASPTPSAVTASLSHPATAASVMAPPLAPVATRGGDDGPRASIVAAAAPAAPPATAATPDWLAAATADSLDFDVALALGLGDQDFTGSA